MSDNNPVAAVTAIQIAMMRATQPRRRGQHPKMHGCVEATFTVHDSLPEALRLGVFARPGDHKAWVRFSNGSNKDDRAPDIHGMAIKLVDVEGERAMAGAPPGEHDFILADHPVFFIRTAEDYALFMGEFARTAPLGQPPVEFIKYLGERYPQDIPVLQGFRNQTQTNPLTAQYWSQVPYAFGPDLSRICRYRAVPVDGVATGAVGDTHDYLRERMVESLSGGGAVAFDFQVQLHEEADAAVINNPTVVWDGPHVTVARLTMEPQTFDTPDRRAFGEALRYSPWHALAVHRPVGEVNEVRRVVYPASQDERGRFADVGSENLRLSDDELRAHIDDEFKGVVDTLSRTFGFLAHSKSGRATHTWGAAGKGTARFITAPEVPPNDFFVFGRQMPIVLRHSSPGARPDDRARDGVAASIKFFDNDEYRGQGVLDILMNAGRSLFVRSIRDFSTFVHASEEERKELVRTGLMQEPELIEAYRIRGSFLDSRYHSWQCFHFIAANGARYLLRFRLIPGDRGPERGLPAPDFVAQGAPSMDPVPDDPRAPDFLRQEWYYQLKYSVVRYILQGQFYPEPPALHPHHEALNPGTPWDEVDFPWLDLCEVSIDEAISSETVARLDFTPNRSPECISIPLATSPDQYASLGHGRALVYPGARAVRAAISQQEQN